MYVTDSDVEYRTIKVVIHGGFETGSRHMSMIENLEKMLASGQDNALLRYTLGSEYLKVGDAEAAIGHLAEAVRQDANYSAAWKHYGKALAEAGRLEDAARTYEQGIKVAEARGDVQAAKEMKVFLKRARKNK